MITLMHATMPDAICLGKCYYGTPVGNHYHPLPYHGSYCFTMVASTVAQCKCLGKGLLRDLQVYHGRLLFPLDYHPSKTTPLYS